MITITKTLKQILEEVTLTKNSSRLNQLYEKLKPYETDSEEELIKIQQENEKYIKENAESLKRKYRSHYIAVREGVVLGHNKNEFRLAEDVIPRFGIFLTIRTVEDVLNPKVVEFPSPQVEE